MPQGCPVRRPPSVRPAVRHLPVPGRMYTERRPPRKQCRVIRRCHEKWQECTDSNRGPSVLETDALPTELHSCEAAAISPADRAGQGQICDFRKSSRKSRGAPSRVGIDHRPTPAYSPPLHEGDFSGFGTYPSGKLEHCWMRMRAGRKPRRPLFVFRSAVMAPAK